jgi:ryanodine receptor 2
MAMLSPSHIKAKINELQQMTVPELFVAFFKMIFYAFYYSGFGVSIIIR